MTMDRNKVVLVDTQDRALREIDKMEAHVNGWLHRAFSVFIFNSEGEMLLQQRARHKYHGGGLWTNACCSHPRWGEDVKLSAENRLRYEMGITGKLDFAFSFIYKAEVENGLTEHELDHVFLGRSDASPLPNPEEVNDFKWQDFDGILRDVATNPSGFTHWFRKALPRISEILDSTLTSDGTPE